MQWVWRMGERGDQAVGSAVTGRKHDVEQAVFNAHSFRNAWPRDAFIGLKEGWQDNATVQFMRMQDQ